MAAVLTAAAAIIALIPMWRNRRQLPHSPAQPEDGSTNRSVTVTGNNPGIIATGESPVIVQHQSLQATVLPPDAIAPPAQIDAPPGLGNLPEHPGLFVGRATDLARLETAVNASGENTVVHAVHGLGGIGKSTLAARYALIHRQDFDLVWWVTADSPAAIDTDLAALAARLQPALTELPIATLRDRAMAWLASHTRWLLVLDNVTDPAHVKALIAQARSGKFVITSRRATGWHGIASAISLDVLSPDESRQLLVAIISHGRIASPPGLDGADALCTELGHLPLAIERPGTYIAETGITPAQYLKLLAGYPASRYAQTAEGGDAQRTIARIWRVTFDQLATTPLAPDLLRLLAFYAPDNIPRSLLDGLADPPQLTKAIGRLAAYNMITIRDGGLAVHRLVQAVTRTPDPADPHRTTTAIDQARAQATTQLAAALPDSCDDPGEWPTWRTLLPHVEALAAHTAPQSETHATALTLNKAASFLKGQGAFPRAIPFFNRSLAAFVRVLGDDHPDTLAARNNLVDVYSLTGDLIRAIPLGEATLDHATQVLGEDHPITLAARNNLAAAYAKAGDLTRAIPLYQANLDYAIQVLGEDDPKTLGARNNLAGAYVSAGNLARAIPLLQATFDSRRRVLGEDHPDTLASRNNLAGMHVATGDAASAILLFQAVIDDRRRVLGKDHPDTLASRNNLAGAYAKAGYPARAIPLYKATLADCLRVLGDSHPLTARVRRDLGILKGKRRPE